SGLRPSFRMQKRLSELVTLFSLFGLTSLTNVHFPKKHLSFFVHSSSEASLNNLQRLFYTAPWYILFFCSIPEENPGNERNRWCKNPSGLVPQL
ncbi:MAG: hypothetical protein KH365_07390, partial [Clostridiales bacterium]|nr:hypothetical protein [Clostridiales bacterium]